MNQSVIIAVSAFAGLAAITLSLVPVAGAVKETERLISFEQPVNADPSALARIKGGEVNCPHCDLRGADLSHECVKGGDLTGADFTGAKVLYMCMSVANFTDVSFRGADLTGANLGQSNLTRADFTGAKLTITSIKGADLSAAKGLTQAQLDSACADAQTKLPTGLHAAFCS